MILPDQRKVSRSMTRPTFGSTTAMPSRRSLSFAT
jgi:hypothetical protein